MVMEFIDGGNLASHLQGGPLEIEKIVRFGVQIARGLASAHKQGYHPSDVKPANILLGKWHRTRIADRLRPGAKNG